MPIHSGPVMAFVVLLMLAGVYKLQDPAPTAGALRGAGLPGSVVIVRGLALLEIGAGAAWLVFGGVWSALAVGALYLGFAGFVLVALWRDLPIASCGCLGSTDTPPSWIHVIANSSGAGFLIWAAVDPIGPLGGLVDEAWSIVVPYLLFVASAVYLLYALLAVLPKPAMKPTESFVSLSTRADA